MATQVQKKNPARVGQNKGKNHKAKQIQKDYTHFWILAGILVVTFIAFFPSLKNGFVNWDDYNYVKDNAIIKDLSSKNISHIFNTSTYVMGNYHPFTVMTYCFEYALFKLDPFYYHLDNILLHLLNIVGVYLFFRLLTGRFDVSIITAILFAVHPLRVESVTWVAERKDVLYTLFFLGSLICYLKYLSPSPTDSLKNAQQKTKNKQLFYAGSLVFFLFSILSKGQAVVLAPVLLLIDYFFKRKFDQKVILEKIPFFILALIFGIIAMKAQNTSLTADRLASHTFLERMLIASYGLVMYIYKFLLPIKLACFYPYPDKIDGFFFIAPLIIAGLGLGVWRLVISLKNTEQTTGSKLQTSSSLVFGSLFFLITVSIVLQFLPVGDAVFAERYTYIPFIGVFFLVSSIYVKLLENKQLKAILKPLGYGIIGIYVILTFIQTQVWKDSTILWTSVLANYPETAVAYNNRGQSYFDKPGELEKAVTTLKTVADGKKRAEMLADLNTKYEVNLTEQNATAEVAKQKEFYMQKAFDDFNKAINYKKDYAYAYKNRGATYQNFKKYDLAVLDYKKALAISPNFASAMFNLGLNYVDAGKPDSAIMYYDMALVNNPDNTDQLYYSKGIAFKMMNRLQESIESYDKAIETNPRYTEAYDNRGNIFFNIGQYDKAISDYNRSIEMDPTNGRAYSNRSMAHYAQKDFTAAMADAQQAMALGNGMDPRYIEALKAGK